MTSKLLGGGATALLMLVLLPVLMFASVGQDPNRGLECGGEISDLGTVLAVIRQVESSGDYTAEAGGSTASGAYQFINSTWGSYGGYPTAAQAPPTIQDQKASEAVNRILMTHPVDMVGPIWFLGHAPTPSEWDRRPPGNSITPREYQRKWLSTLTALQQTTTPIVCPTSSGAAERSGTLTKVEGITVDESIAVNLAALLAAARADGVVLSGWGWRSTQRQIELRTTNGCPNVWTAPAASCRIPTAIPGSSMHEQGLAIDFTQNGKTLTRTSTGFKWLTANAARYGLRGLSSESWHWSTTGN